MTEFEGWASVDKDPNMQFDWDDLAGDARRREVRHRGPDLALLRDYQR